METLVGVLDDLLQAPLRIIEWQILSKHPELWSDEGIAFLREERERAWKKRDYKRIGKLSSKLLTLERSQEVGIEKAFFGRELEREQREAFEAAISQEVVNEVTRAEEYKDSAQWDEAIVTIDRLLNQATETDNKIFHAELQFQLGDILWRCPIGDRAKNLEKTIELCKIALTVMTREAFPYDWALTQNNMAIAYLYRIRGDRAENLEKAIELYKAVLTVHTREAFPYGWTRAQNNMANAYYVRIRGDRAENLEKAIELYEAALTVHTREAFPYNWALTQNNLANAYGDRILGDRVENLEKAIKLYEAALTEHTRDAFPYNWAVIQNNMAEAYWSHIRSDHAENVEKAIELNVATPTVFTLKTFSDDWAETQNSMARVYQDYIRGDRLVNLKKAQEHYRHALTIWRPETFPRECRETAIELAGIQLLQQLWSDALDSSHLSRKADRILQQQATSLSGKEYEIEKSATLYYLASLTSAHLGDIFSALEWLERGKTRELGEALARDRVLFKEGLREEDRNRYVRNLERLRVLEAEQRGAVPGARSFTEVAEDTRRVHAELEQLIVNIQKYLPEFLGETTISRDEIQSLFADEDMAYIVFNVTAYGTMVILLTRGEGSPVAESFFIAGFTSETMDKLAGRWSHGLEELKRGKAVTTGGRRRWWGEIEEIGRKLYLSLFSPVHQWLQSDGRGIERLVLVPHLSLHVLPLHLMRYDVDGEPRYLAEDYEVSYAPGISVILQQWGMKGAPAKLLGAREVEAGRGGPPFLLVSNPTGDLVWSQEEVQHIEELYQGEKKILAGSEATRDRLFEAASGSRYLHFSCHGEFDPVDPWNSGLILADDRHAPAAVVEEPAETIQREDDVLEKVCHRDQNGNVVMEVRTYRDGAEERINYDGSGAVHSTVRSLPDGRRYLADKGRLLTLKEIVSGLDLGTTELVVLSACESGLVGFRGKSDEFVGLPGGFLRAGARNVVASLWVVDDQATAMLMERFYRYLFEEGLPPSKALRRAQLEVKQEHRWRNPYYWGAFRTLGA